MGVRFLLEMPTVSKAIMSKPGSYHDPPDADTRPIADEISA